MTCRPSSPKQVGRVEAAWLALEASAGEEAAALEDALYGQGAGGALDYD